MMCICEKHMMENWVKFRARGDVERSTQALQQSLADLPNPALSTQPCHKAWRETLVYCFLTCVSILRSLVQYIRNEQNHMSIDMMMRHRGRNAPADPETIGSCSHRPNSSPLVPLQEPTLLFTCTGVGLCSAVPVARDGDVHPIASS